MDEVLWHSTTFLLAKSIFVKMPKLPTIRVIGSQDISTIFSGWVRVSLTGAVAVDIVISFYWLDFGGRPKMDLLGVGVVFGPIARLQFGTRMTPAWFLICRTLRNLAQSLNNSSGNSGNCGGDHRAWRRIHER